MNSTVRFHPDELRDADRLARRIHNAICGFHLLRGRAPSTVSVHPSDMQHLLVGAVESVIFLKGIALVSDEGVQPGTARLTTDWRVRVDGATRLPASAIMRPRSLAPQTLSAN